MNLYIIVEGDKTELKVYPKWIEHLTPHLTRIYNAWDVKENNYYLFSGAGIPSIYNHIIHAVEDINNINSKENYKFDYLLIFMDTEEGERKDIEERIKKDLEANKLILNNFEILLFEQKVCMETWFLGNERIWKRNPQDPELLEYIDFYDVSNNDPELMGSYHQDSTKAQFHFKYLKKMLKERHISYSKTNPQEVTKKDYLNSLIERYQTTNHIPTFGRWYEFFSSIK